MLKILVLCVSHGGVLAIGFVLGIYMLPIITAPAAPDAAVLEESASGALFTAELSRDLRGNDFLHWGEGTISITPTQIIHAGSLAPGPDYKLYLLTEFVEHEDEFLPIKDQAQLIGDVDSFSGVMVDVPAGVDVRDYSTVLIWCEAFGEFITAARYQ